MPNGLDPDEVRRLHKYQIPLPPPLQREFQEHHSDTDYAKYRCKWRREANKALGRPEARWLRLTRFKLDLLLPLGYSTVWIILVNARLQAPDEGMIPQVVQRAFG